MWNWIDRFWDTIETLEGSARYMKIVYQWFLRWRPPQSENDYIEFLINKIRHDAYVYRAFMDLLHREDGKHPSIISNWRSVESGQLKYIGQKPTEEDMEKKGPLPGSFLKELQNQARLLMPMKNINGIS